MAHPSDLRELVPFTHYIEFIVSLHYAKNIRGLIVKNIIIIKVCRWGRWEQTLGVSQVFYSSFPRSSLELFKS